MTAEVPADPADAELWGLAVDELDRRNLGRIADHFRAALAERDRLAAQLAAIRTDLTSLADFVALMTPVDQRAVRRLIGEIERAAASPSTPEVGHG